MGGVPTLRRLEVALVAPLAAACLQSPPTVGEPSCEADTDISQIALGRDHTCALLESGGVWCWGLNDQGQLGDGTAIDRSEPSQVGELRDVTRLVVGQDHSCALEGDGSLWCWGSGSNGQLGDGGTDDSFAPVQSDLDGVVDVSLGDDFSCAVTTDGAVHCWGENEHGQVGPGFGDGQQAEDPVEIELDGVARKVVAGHNHACVLLEGGGVACWGGDDAGQLGDGMLAEREYARPVTGLDDVTVLAAGGDHTCAITGDRSLWCWGSNERGQLGLAGDSEADDCISSSGLPLSCLPLEVDLGAPVLAVAGGLHHTCALLEGGAVWCFGGNQAGQLGNGTYDDSTTPAKVSIEKDIVSIAAGEAQTCAASADHSVYCWGSNRTAQLGETAALIATTPVVVQRTNGATAVAAGENYTCAMVAGDLVCWGANDASQLGDGTLQARSSPTPTTVLNGAPRALAPGEEHTCVINGVGKIRCWGRNDHGEVAPESGEELQLSAVNVDIGATTAVQIDSGDEHVCAVGSDMQAWCWGSNDNGKLGNSGAAGAGPDPATGLSAVVEVACGDEHTCARLASGGINCWGANAAGQLGDSSTDPRDAPGSSDLALDSVRIDAGHEFSCSLDGAGVVSCWGDNAYGQLGAGIEAGRSLEPMTVALPMAASALAVGAEHACVIGDGPTQAPVMCWGRNDGGQLGNGTTETSFIPVAVELDGEPLAITAGGRHTCALVRTAEGDVVECWGSDIDGTLGSGRALYQTTASGAIRVCP